jgi:hypothetical protein
LELLLLCHQQILVQYTLLAIPGALNDGMLMLLLGLKQMVWAPRMLRLVDIRGLRLVAVLLIDQAVESEGVGLVYWLLTVGASGRI